MLGYFLEEASSRMDITLAYVESTRIRDLIPPGVETILLPENQRFSIGGLIRQISVLCRAKSEASPQILHGWAARDWELTVAAARVIGSSCMGSLHDHPEAVFISPPRQRLMRWSALLGMDRIICVSNAVRRACLLAGYEDARLRVIHNGLKYAMFEKRVMNRRRLRLGFLGGFSEVKGIRGFFAVADLLFQRLPGGFELAVAGGAQDEMGERMMREIAAEYGGTAWWPEIRWCGWVSDPTSFLRSIDVLIFPSTDFDSFPTVLLEAGRVGVPTLATQVGGVAEIIANGVNGWIIEPGDWRMGAEVLTRLLSVPDEMRQCGMRARSRVELEFSVQKMVAEHLALYSELQE